MGQSGRIYRGTGGGAADVPAPGAVETLGRGHIDGLTAVLGLRFDGVGLNHWLRARLKRVVVAHDAGEDDGADPVIVEKGAEAMRRQTVFDQQLLVDQE